MDEELSGPTCLGSTVPMRAGAGALEVRDVISPLAGASEPSSTGGKACDTL